MLNKEAVVSVIIPVYNVEKYLSDCLESVCNQTYTSLEIIVVDDESPDNSGKIADEFSKKDQRVKVLHIKNRGAAGARNAALDICTGDYIMFVDSDDWLENNAIEIMMKHMISNNCDMVLCQYYDEFIGAAEKHTFLESDFVCSDCDFVRDMIKKWEYIINWNKIYKASAIGKIRFVEGRCIDDEFFTYKAVLNMNKIFICTDYLYHYRMRKSSAMGSTKNKNQRHIDQVDFITQRYEPLKKAYPQLKPMLLTHMAEVLMSVIRNSKDVKETFLYAKKKLREYSVEILLNGKVSLQTKKSVLVYLLKSPNNIACPEKESEFDRERYFD